MTSPSAEARRRRTFAIISHPDAGKTTLTEKFLLYGGAVQEAGQVKARGERRRARSDWMELEQKRGISITSAVLQFPYRAVFGDRTLTGGGSALPADALFTPTIGLAVLRQMFSGVK